MREINGPIKALCKQLHINFLNRRKTNLGALIAHKRPCNDIFDMKEAIYKIPCKECEVNYLGETKWKLGTRTKEHCVSCQKAFLSQAVHQSVNNDTGLPYHFHHSGHSFDFDKVQLVQQERIWVKRKILEALYIQTTANTCNLNSDENWLTFFQFFSSLPFSWIIFW